MITSTSEAMYAYRTRLGMSQEEVAKAVGISRVTYTRYENGTHKPDAYNAVKIAHLFGVPIEHLLCMELPEQEDEIVSLSVSARRLNAAGRKMLDQYIKFLISQPEYKKDSLDTRKMGINGDIVYCAYTTMQNGRGCKSSIAPVLKSDICNRDFGDIIRAAGKAALGR